MFFSFCSIVSFCCLFLFLFVSYSCFSCYYTGCACCCCCCCQCFLYWSLSCSLFCVCKARLQRCCLHCIAGLQWFQLPHPLDAICAPFTIYEYCFTLKSNCRIYFKTVIWYKPMILNLNDCHLHVFGSSPSSQSSRWKGRADALESQWEGQGLVWAFTGPYFAETQGCMMSRDTSSNIYNLVGPQPCFKGLNKIWGKNLHQ